MEHYIYDRAARLASWLMLFPFLLPICVLTAVMKGSGGHIPDDLIWAFGGILFVGIAAFLAVYVSSDGTVKIDVADRKVIHAWRLFGLTVRQTQADLSLFNSVSMHRLYRGGYRATLLGRDKEVTLCVTTDLARLRALAEEAAKLAGLKLADHL
jgi:hypothetical protein